ncbi:hypothetical protein [Streptomyces sp. NPDC020951]|uniref:hypothetical protein n=1 Tax=Streptomyces sp. NPDC020951 TaxID=3365104 RepID=UPI0037A17442
MTAVEEARSAGASGKSIHDSGLSVDGATRATLPQQRYADALHAALDALQLLPDTLRAGLRIEPPRGPRELYVELEWLPGHDDLVPAAAQMDGLTVAWSHLAGWSVRCGPDVVALDVDKLAAPTLIADAAMHAALYGIGRGRPEPPDPGARWEHAVYLDIALVAYDERTDGVSG